MSTPQDYLVQGLGTLQEIALAHHRALQEIAHTFGAWDEASSVHQLTQSKPTVPVAEVTESDQIRSIGVVNLSAVTINLGVGGNSANATGGIPVPAMSYLVLPLSFNELELAAEPSELEGLAAPARVLVIRFRRNQSLSAGRLTSQSSTGTSAVAMSANSNLAFEASNASEQLVGANPARTGLEVQNNSSQNVTLAPGTKAAISGQGIVLEPGGSWNGMVGPRVWGGAVQVIGAAAGPLLVAVIEV